MPESDNWIMLKCERCGYPREAQLSMPDGYELTGDECVALLRAGDMILLCDRCAQERGAE